MKKLKLDVDELRVESFDTRTPAGERGTVHGHLTRISYCDICETDYLSCLSCDVSCDGSCAATCDATCPNTCQATCQASCNGSCVSCVDTCYDSCDTCAASCYDTCGIYCTRPIRVCYYY